MSVKVTHLIPLMVLLCIAVPEAHARKAVGKIELLPHGRRDQKMLNQIKFEEKYFPVYVAEDDTFSPVETSVSVILKEPKVNTLAVLNPNGDQVSYSASDTGLVKFPILLKGHVTPFTLYMVGMRGDLHAMEFRVRIVNWPEMEPVFKRWIAKKEGKPFKDEKTDQRLIASVSLAQMLFTYKQSFVDRYNALGLNLAATAAFDIVPEKWRVRAEGAGTLLPFADGNDAVSARLLRAELTGGWVFWKTGSFSFEVDGGLYYHGLHANDSAFGYRLFGLLLYPEVRYTFDEDNHLVGRLSFGPLAENFGISFERFELRALARWRTSLWGHQVSLDGEVLASQIKVGVKTGRGLMLMLGGGYHF